MTSVARLAQTNATGNYTASSRCAIPICGFSYRMPISLHKVSGYALNMASQQFAASVFNCPRIECRPWYDEAPEAAGNIPVVKNGFMQVSSLPGLGILLDQGHLKANLADGEPWWG